MSRMDTNYGDNEDNGPASVKLSNPHLRALPEDVLYHLGLGTKSHDLVDMFGDVKFVCMGGTARRMERFARYAASELRDKLPPATEFLDLKDQSYRYNMYKVGPILAVSHGMGVPSLQILLHELVKLLHYARAKEPVLIRIGTSGGLGVPAGSVIVSDGAVDELVNPYHEQAVLGHKIRRPALLDAKLARELASLHEPERDEFELHLGKTMCAMDFYEGQGRLDGAFCDYGEADKMAYLHRLHDAGVRNIEMEATSFAAFTHHAGIKAGIVCVALVDRFKGDQVQGGEGGDGAAP